MIAVFLNIFLILLILRFFKGLKIVFHMKQFDFLKPKIADFIEDFGFLDFRGTVLPVLCPLNFWRSKTHVSRETFYIF